MAAPAKKAPDIKKIIGKFQSECHGECSGFGTGVSWNFGECPDPVDQRALDWVTHLARVNAGEDAQDVCVLSSKNCMCVGEFVELVEARCIPIDTQMGKAHIYFSAYAYLGECSHWL